MPVNNFGHLRISIQYFLELTVVLLVGRNFGEVVTPPCTGRQVLNSSFGIISDGTNVYHPSSHCEWLIIGGPKKFVSLEFVSMSTECTYDYLFVYNGPSFNDDLLGAFSGESDPGTLVAKSVMMVYFFSDRNYVRQGFLAKFYVSDCPMNCSNHGRCNEEDGVCECDKEFTGDGCQYLLCSDYCEKGHASSNCTTSNCRCRHGFPECNASGTGWKMISENGFKRRAGLSGAYVRSLERLYLFGGFDLQRSLNDLFYYDFKSHTWGTVEQPIGRVWPSGRHGHTMGILGDRIVLMFGGSRSDDNFSSELWMFDVHSEIWKLLKDPDKSLPPTTGHAMVVTSSGWLYLLGGMTVNGTFLSDLWRCNVSHLISHDGDPKISWEKLNPKGGLIVDRRLIGHSMVHDSKSDRLLIFGGIAVDSARFPRRSPSLQVYHIGENWWADLSHFGRNSLAPRERAFHQATMVGDYMVVVGGNVHSHHEDEHCYDGNIFFLHLQCMTWVDGTKFESSSDGGQRRIKGRYSHFATLADDRTVLLAGGFRGSLLGSLEAYVFPENMVASINQSEEGDHKCALHKSMELCTSDPNCLWCSVKSTNTCLYRMSSEKCQPGTLSHSFCPGICEFLKTCESCATLGRSNAPSLDDCGWCVIDSKCRKIYKMPESKCTTEPNASTHEGWWKGLQTQLVDVPGCISDNKPPGLLWLRYKNPVNPKILEEVELVRNSTQMFHFNTAMDKEYHQEFTYMARLVGFIHPPRTPFPIHLTVFGSTVQTWLYLSTNSSASHKALVAESKMSTYFNLEAKRPNGRPLFGPNSGRYYVEMVVNQTTAPSPSQMSVEVGLRWNITSSPFRKNPVIGTEFLEPPNGGICSAFETCTSCLTDFSCGWCVDSCMARSSVAQSPAHRCYPGSRSTQYFITNLTHCITCSNHTTCHECLVDPSCEWSVMEARCFKRGQFNDSLVDAGTCPLPCHLRSNITWCLQDENECAWCEDMRRCFAFVEYIPRYPFGGCRMWLDSATDIVPLFDCTSIKNCSSCIRTHLCGWCYLTTNPSVGICRRGHFLGPYDGISCDEAVSSSFDRNETSTAVHSWSYEKCEDVDECTLDMHDCHENAVCINTVGSYNCSCKRGFTGDGVLDCERTCYELCTNGRCSGPPHYICECDLGWTGEACNIDCGCYFHSTCLTGSCDRCIHGTRGTNCQSCMTGFFGNSTSTKGCSPCQCNGHADENKGICDGHDGVCHCKDDTAGRNCQTCAEGFYGDPRDSGKCFKECEGRSLILGATEGGLGTANLKNELGHLFCLWVLSVNDRLDSHQSASQVIALTIHKDVNISCAKERLYIYDGIPDDFGFPSGPPSHLVAAICGEELRKDLVFQILSGSLVIFFEFSQSAGNSPPGAYYGFNATYKVSHDEPGYCNATCDDNSVPPFPLRVVAHARPPTHVHTCMVDGCPALHPNLMGHSVVHYSGEGLKGAFIFGGKNFSAVSDELWFVQDGSSQWKLVTSRNSLRPSARYFHASDCLLQESKIFIHGGILAGERISDELWTYNLDSKIWSLSEALGSPALAGHSLSAVGDNNLIVVGCLPFLGQCTVVHKFDANVSRWSSLPEAVELQGIYGHSAAYSRRERVLYIHGGYQWEETSGFQRTNRLYALNLENRSPMFVVSDGDLTYQPNPSSMHSSFALDDLVIVIGGDFGARLFHSYFPSCDVWMELDPSGIELPEGLQYFGKFWSDGKAIFGTAASGSLRRTGVTRLDFGGVVYKLIGESERCQGPTSCRLCSIKTQEELCMANSTVDQQCFRIGRPKQATKDDPPKHCTTFTSRSTCANRVRDCSWCSKCSKCISANEDCNRTCIQSFLEGVQRGSNDTCRSFLNCSNCLKLDKCAWRIPRCNSKGCSLGRCHPRSSNSSLGSKCPPPCRQHSSCSTCLNSDSTCLWSVTGSKCYSAYETGLSCSFGECGTLLSWGKKHLCPRGCEGESSCSSCLRKPHCGWCSSRRVKPDPGGAGVCMEGGLNGPRFNACQTDLFARDGAKTKEGSLVPPVSAIEWSFITCPGEDECQNGHHTCDNTSQFCEDKEVGFECQCKDGFNFNPELGRCQPHCKQGCLHGTCTSPDVCKCHFGYVGLDCSVECQCNKHSNCESELNKAKCLNCSNNTMGNTCDLCRPLFVGNPKNGGKCEPCLKYCNEHSRICLSREDFNHTLNYPDLPTNEENIGQWLKFGSYDSKNTKCKSCANNTQGDRCEKCKPGHFRQPHLLPSTACQKCLCNRHSDYCDPEKGDGCDCRNNTKSPRCDSSDSSKLCFKVQCSQCVDNFLGTPTDGHQCYRQMSVESQHCFDPLTQMNCNPTRDPDPLLRNRTVFFAIQPKYLNVNIRIFIDVTRGGLNLYFAPFDNAFQVFVNPQDGIHRVVVDPAYKLYDPKTGVTINNDQESEEYDDHYVTDNIDGDNDVDDDDDDDEDDENSRSDDEEDLQREKEMPDVSPKKSTGARLKRGFTSVSGRNKKLGTSQTRERSYPTSSTAAPQKSQMSFRNDKQPGADKFFHLEKVVAKGLTTFITVDKPETFLFVENIVNRLVVILPNNVHPLKVARFYLVLLGVDSESYGSVYMRQDQPHIDLFVFFSVFFSCFFLFLAVCVLLWKAKQMNDARRSRHRSLLEMEHMASRPSAHVIVVVDGHSGIGDFYGKEMRTSVSHQQGSFRTLVGLNNAEGDKLTASMTSTRTTGVGRTQNKKVKNFVVHPIAVEYTHDNAVAVATFLFELPGANTARIRSCFGSCMVLPGSNLQASTKV